MATYSALTFLAPYAPTDTILKLVNSNAQRVAGINVCQYEKSSAEGNQLWIYLEDAKHRILDFNTPQEALQALTTFRAAVEALRPNCFSAIPVAPPQTINPITLAAYKSQQLSNTLIALQWYDVADTGPTYDLGPVIRMQAKTSNDFQPSGVSLTTNELVTINVIDDSIVRRENTTKKTLATTQSFISADNTSTYIHASNYSTITAIGSTRLEATNNSTLNATVCSDIYIANGANITILSGTNVFIDGITADFTAYTSLVNDVNINQTSTIGKLGREDMVVTDNEILYSYINLVELVTPTLTASINKILDNIAPQANGEFRVLVGPNLGAYTITIQDTTLANLFVISASMVNSIVTFRWNKITTQFEYVPDVASENVVTLPVTMNGQVAFTLAPNPVNPTLSELSVNGQVQEYGFAADYYIAGNTLFWNNNDFQLETDDVVILKYT